MGQKLISICIPTYNRPLELKRMLESIDTTKYDDVDIVISENCSQKQIETREVVEQYKQSHPYEIHYFENERNLGYDKNIRALVKRATGRFCMFFSDDDMFMPNAMDEFVEFIRGHQDCGYILRSYRNYNADETQWQDFRYYATDRTFEPGRDTAIELFDKSVFLSGFTIRQGYAKDYETDALDGSLLYQQYLLLEVCRRYPSAYSRILISKAVPISGGVHYFGSGDGEEGYTEGTTMQDGSSAINFFKWYIRFYDYVENLYKDGTGKQLKRNDANLCYPTMAGQLRTNPSKKEFRKFCRELFDAGLERTFYCNVYYYSLLIFGYVFCDKVIAFIKRKLGYRPKL